MKRSRRSWWIVYGACAFLALGALAWVTRTVLALERAEREARLEAGHQQALRLALWRMDSWLGPQLAREAARPVHDYLAYSPQERAYTRILNRIEPGDVLTPSPLLAQDFELFQLHFQVDEKGTWSSPRVPEGNWLDLAQASGAGAAGAEDARRIEAARAELAQLARLASRDELAAALARGEAELGALLDEAPQAAGSIGGAALGGDEEALRSKTDLSQRMKSNYQAVESNQWAVPAPLAHCGTTVPFPIEVGALVALWLGGSDAEEPALCFVRRVRAGGQELLQGFRADWGALRERLLEQVSDLFPEAGLVALREGALAVAPSGERLASLPALFTAPPAAAAPPDLASPARATLLLSWIAALVALGAVGLTLASSIAFGEKQRRFASAVTHELRTPLTTFRMYSEMLARGMVPLERRAEYFVTLERESARLATLVENVLRYARLENGRAPLSRERVTVGALVGRALPALEARAKEAGLALALELDGVAEIELDTDPEAVGQILFNLIDNACKYGRSPAGEPLELAARPRRSGIEISVRDHGPGVPPAVARSIFHPFERGGQGPADPVPGVGLGLALSRGLARDLGGELTLDPNPAPGATFRLVLSSTAPALSSAARDFNAGGGGR